MGMGNGTFKDIIPAGARKPVYVAYGLTALALGALQAAYLAVHVPQPDWLTATWAAVGVIGSALGFTAAGNTDTTRTPPASPMPAPPIQLSEPIASHDTGTPQAAAALADTDSAGGVGEDPSLADEAGRV